MKYKLQQIKGNVGLKTPYLKLGMWVYVFEVQAQKLPGEDYIFIYVWEGVGAVMTPEYCSRNELSAKIRSYQSDLRRWRKIVREG